MIRYVRGTDLDMSTIYQAFQRGFADYIIQFNLIEAEFTDRFSVRKATRGSTPSWLSTATKPWASSWAA